MASLNRCEFIGNVGNLPEEGIKELPSGAKVYNFSIAVNRKYTQNGETVEETEWVDISAWNRTAEIAAQYLSKGSQVYVSGRAKTDKWEKDGVMHSRTRYHIQGFDSLVLLGSRGEGAATTAPSEQFATMPF